MASEKWTTDLVTYPRRYVLDNVELSGPGVLELVRLIAVVLADAAAGEGSAAEAWDEYTTARLNVEGAREFGADEVSIEDLEQRETDALMQLVEVLPHKFRMRLPEARLVAQLLDEACGRVGIGERAA